MSNLQAQMPAMTQTTTNTRPSLPHTAMRVSPLTVADLPQVMQIEPTIYSHPWTLGNFKDSLAAGHVLWGMHFGEVLVGYAVVMTVLDEAHLLNLSVAKAYQGQGLGRALLTHVISDARARAAANVFLEVRVSNQTAIRLYESMGFCEMAIRRGYYPSAQGREDAVLMGLALCL